jgi:hypothetical protein
MSNELSTPKVLVCSSDTAHQRASDWDTYVNEKVAGRIRASYFVGLDADETKPQTILSGDWNLKGGGGGNVLSWTWGGTGVPTSDANWDVNVHTKAGNMGLGDGSVQQVTDLSAQKQIVNSLQGGSGGSSTNAGYTVRCAIPVAN